jgi:hypothetical protein
MDCRRGIKGVIHMSGSHLSAFVWAVAAIQVLGLLLAWMARLSEGSRRQTLCQRLFFAALVLVGLGTIVLLGMGPGYWLVSGTTLSLMVLTVTCDFSRSPRAGAWES